MDLLLAPLTRTELNFMVCSMKLYRDYRELRRLLPTRRVVTIGNFDGVHLGHRFVLGAAKTYAHQNQLEMAVLTFEPHPAKVLLVGQPPLRLVTQERKNELLAECGADLVLAQRFDMDFASLAPGEFADSVLGEALLAKRVIVGENFRFGSGRSGDIDLLRELGAKIGFEVASENMTTAFGGHISSSRIRDLIIDGDVGEAASLLGRPHELCGEVVHGKGSGRILGFPTANLGNVEVLIPGPGIYAALAVASGKEYPAAVYTGSRPTLGHGQSLEAHLLGYTGDLYGEKLLLRLIKRVRKEIKFENVEQLKGQIESDVIVVKETIGSFHGR